MEEELFKKKRIGIDIDDVICEFVKPYLEFHNKKFKTFFEFENLNSNFFWEDLGHTRETIAEHFDDFQSNFTSLLDLPLVEDAITSINNLSKNNEIFIITARPEEIMFETEQFLRTFLPKVDFKLIHSGDVHGKNKSKADICNDLNIDIMIEDGLSFCLNCARKGVKAFLFDRPWNQSDELPQNVIRVKNWKEIMEKI